MAVDRSITKNVEDSDRQSLQMRDRNMTVDDKILSDDERLEVFRNMFYQASLPDLPKIPGYHVCWLTTSNPRDTIHMRQRMGYSPVSKEDIPGWEHLSLNTGEYAGMIGINEMLAFKLPLQLYERFMYENHYKQPLEKEMSIVNGVDNMKEMMRSQGASVSEENGMQEIRKNRGLRPKFNIE